MTRPLLAALCGLVAVALAPAADPQPRLDPDGEPLPKEAVQRLGSLRFLVNNFTAAAFSPDGKVVYTISGKDASDLRRPGGYPGLVAWEVPTGKKLWQAGVDRRFEQVVADPDGKSVWAIVVGLNADDEIVFERLQFSAADGKEMGRMTIGDRDLDNQAALHPSGRVAHWTDDFFAERWTLRVFSPAGENTLTRHFDYDKFSHFRDTEWSPAADRLYVITRDNSSETSSQVALNPSDGKTLWEHSMKGWCEWRVTPDGKRLVGCLQEVGKDNERPPPIACCWDADTGKVLARLKVPDLRRLDDGLDFERALRGQIFLTPDSKAVFLNDENDRTVAIDMATWKVIPTKQSFPEQTHFSPDGRYYLAPWGRHVGLYDTATGKRLSPHASGFSTSDSTVDLRFSFDSQRVLRTDWWRYPQLEWSVTTGKEARRASWKELVATVGTEHGISDTFERELRGVCVSSDGTKRASRVKKSDGWQILVTTADKPNAPPVVLDVPLTDTNFPFAELLFTPDSGHLIGYHEDRLAQSAFRTEARKNETGLYVWDTRKGGKPAIAKFGTGHAGPTHSRYTMELSPNGTQVAVVIENGPRVYPQFVSKDSSWILSVFDVPAVKLVHRFSGPGAIASFGWTGQGEVAMSVDRTPLGNPFTSEKYPPKFEVVCLSPTTKEKRAFTPEAIPNCCAVSPVGDTVAIGSDDGLRLYEASTGKVRHRFKEQTRPVEVLAFSPNGRYLAAESVDGPLLVWDVRGDLTKPAKPDAAGWDTAWGHLGEQHAESAFRAVRLFALFPDDGAAELARRFAAGSPTPEQIAKAVADLDNADFPTRQQAEQRLREMGSVAFAALKAGLARDPSEEFQQRATRLLAVTVPADRLRAERAVEALRLADTDATRAQLAAWAKGPADNPLTAAAKRATKQ